jgi:hypothetical protein
MPLPGDALYRKRSFFEDPVLLSEHFPPLNKRLNPDSEAYRCFRPSSGAGRVPGRGVRFKPLRFIRDPDIVSGMQCPDCGYDVDDAAVFCPQCRFRFQETDDTAFVPATPLPEGRVNNTETDESIFEEKQKAFSSKELRILDLQLIQPAILVVLVISLFVYTLISAIPFIPLTIAGLNFGVTGILSLACGILAGMIFFFFLRRSLQKFRYR